VTPLPHAQRALADPGQRDDIADAQTVRRHEVNMLSRFICMLVRVQ
jgi:hypothetical protein